MGSGLVFLGIFLEILSTLSGTVGKLLIRYGALMEQKKDSFKRGRRFGAAGLLLNTTCSPTLDICAYTFAPQAVIAPFAGLDVAWNALLAPCTLGETLSRTKLAAIMILFAGVCCTLLFVNTVEPEYTTSYCRDLLFSWRTGIYMIALFSFIWLNLGLQKRLPKGNNMRGLSLGVTGGTLAGNMFCVKIFGEFLQRSFNQRGFATLWEEYIAEHTGLFLTVFFGAIFFALSNVWFVAVGMREFEALFMVTVFEGSMIVSGCICGTIVMKDFDGEPWGKILGFFLCVCAMMGGIYILFVAQMQQTSSLFNKTASIHGVHTEEAQMVSPAGIVVLAKAALAAATTTPSTTSTSIPPDMNITMTGVGDGVAASSVDAGFGPRDSFACSPSSRASMYYPFRNASSVKLQIAGGGRLQNAGSRSINTDNTVLEVSAVELQMPVLEGEHTGSLPECGEGEANISTTSSASSSSTSSSSRRGPSWLNNPQNGVREHAAALVDWLTLPFRYDFAVRQIGDATAVRQTEGFGPTSYE